jgi:competence protein CoiA
VRARARQQALSDFSIRSGRSTVQPRITILAVLTALRQSDGLKVVARDAERADAPFSCASCAAEMTLKKGALRIHHFAHKAPTVCRLGVGETEDHYLVKLAIHDALREEANVENVELEKRLPGAVADVFAVISGVPVAVEVQRSVLGIADVAARTARYHRLGIAVVWVALPDGDLSFDRYSPSAWERWCHAACFGRVYYWARGQWLRPVHYAPVSLHVPQQTWRKAGRELSAGGYDRRSRLWVRPAAGEPVSLSAHFQRRVRPAWSGGKMAVPDCTLFIDRQPAWWV